MRARGSVGPTEGAPCKAMRNLVCVLIVATTVLTGCANPELDTAPLALAAGDRGVYYIAEVRVAQGDKVTSDAVKPALVRAAANGLAPEMRGAEGKPARLDLQVIRFSGDHPRKYLTLVTLTDRESDRRLLFTRMDALNPYKLPGHPVNSSLVGLFAAGVMEASWDKIEDPPRILIDLIRQRILIPNDVGVDPQGPVAAD